ncbi:MAG: replication initiator protein A, partial [Pseudomonadota bacterium]
MCEIATQRFIQSRQGSRLIDLSQSVSILKIEIGPLSIQHYKEAVRAVLIPECLNINRDFGLIDRFRIVRETREGRMQDLEVTLSEWVFNAIRSREVLTLHRNYFRLRKPLERRLYEIARKHCGAKPEWTIGLEKLKRKCGSHSTDKEFRRLLSNIVAEDQAHGHMPDYAIALDGELVIFRSRGSVPA